jgi:hypothetical protein
MVDVNTRRASRRRCWRTAACALEGATALAGCSWGGLTRGGPGSSAAPAAPPPTPAADSSFTGRVKSFFTGSSGSSLPPAPPAGPSGIAAPAVDCPPVEYRQGAATLAVSSAEAGTFGLRYQGNFVQTARECQLRGGQLTIKVGVQGRIVIGPAGAPNQITIPLRYALVREGQEQKTIWTKLFMVPVMVPDGELNVPFIHVEEEMTVPNPPPAELDAYVIYIGFDPEGATAPKPKPAAKPKTARAKQG